MQRIGKKVDVDLFYAAPVIAFVLLDDPVLETRNAYLACHLAPYPWTFHAAKLRSLAGVLQRDDRHAVGEGVVVHTHGIFVRAHYVVYRVCAVGVTCGAAYPEVGYFLYERIAFLLKPFPVLRHAVVVPCRNANVAGYVVFERTGERPRWAGFLACVIALPWEHHSHISVCLRLLAGGSKTVETVVNHRFCHILIEEQQRRIHPYLSIPEYVSVVSL